MPDQSKLLKGTKIVVWVDNDFEVEDVDSYPPFLFSTIFGDVTIPKWWLGYTGAQNDWRYSYRPVEPVDVDVLDQILAAAQAEIWKILDDCDHDFEGHDQDLDKDWELLSEKDKRKVVSDLSKSFPAPIWDIDYSAFDADKRPEGWKSTYQKPKV